MDKEIFYQGDLNTKRIAAYNKLANDYNVSVSTVRDIFSAGISFACESTPAEDWVIEFGNHLQCDVSVTNNQITVLSACNGWGDQIPLEQIKILSSPPKK